MFKMAKKKKKLATPEWILEGYDSKEDYDRAKGVEGKKKKSGRVFKIRKCPECDSEKVGLVLSGSDAEEGGGTDWECHECGWSGNSVKEEELNEDEFMEYMDRNDKGGEEDGN